MELKELNEEQITLLNWLDGVAQYDYPRKQFHSFAELVREIETNHEASINSTITFKGKTYNFTMTLTKEPAVKEAKV